MARWIRFFIMISLGIGLGLAYGWLISPTRFVDTSPNTLRVDYKTDYVLMVAETYQNEQDLDLAVHRLAVLGDLPPKESIKQAVVFAQKAGYSEPDIARMRALSSAFENLPGPQGTSMP